MKTQGVVDLVFPYRQLSEQLFQDTRIATTHSMQLIRVLPSIGLDVSSGDSCLDQGSSFGGAEWRALHTREVVNMLPQMSEVLRLVRVAHDPSWNVFDQMCHETRNSRRGPRHVIEGNWLIAMSQMIQ